ncbi:MAG TPA: AAA family ATPase [Candidatus Limnocylindria bacterium]|jgi:class 3 adenylate cyclase/tetratricopeptide (TPR) repeat protein
MARTPRGRDSANARVTRVFLFTDLRDYTRFVEAHGDVAATRLLRDYRTIVRREVTRTRGAEIKTEGDSFYIVFESAVPALDCAVAILKRVRAHNAKHPDRALQVGAGLHAGDAITYDDQYVGGAVIVAARLSTKAAAGELLVSDTTRGLVRTGQTHRLVERGTVVLKGVSESIRVWSVDFGDAQSGTSTAQAPLPNAELQRRAEPGQLICPVLIGRERELAAFRTILVDASAGRGGIVFVSGEPGIGKSAFAREAAGVANVAGYRLMAGAALQWESGLPYGPFLSALRSGFQGDALRDAITRVAPDIAPLLPELGHAPVAADSPLERHRIGRAFTDLLTTLSKQAPLLLVLEDLHWVDEASIALLQQLARELLRTPVVVLITYRSDEVLRRHPLSTLVADLARARLSTAMTLQALDQADTERLIRATLSGVPLDQETQAAIYARSEGNALFTEELLKSLVGAGAIVHQADRGWQPGGGAQLRLPETLRDLVIGRVERLRPSTVATLAAASIIGGRFDYDTLRRVRGIEEAELTNDLRQAVDEQLVVEQREGDGSFAFRHALTREVIYDDLLLPERQRLHLLVAAALVAGEHAPPAIVARHWRAGGDRQRAAQAYEMAGNDALAVNAASEAVAAFEAAITASGQATSAHYLGLARAYLAIDHLKARSAAERGTALLTEADGLGRRIDLLHIAGRARWLMGDGSGNLELARSAVDLVRDETDSPVKADALAWFAGALSTRGDTADAREWAERALAVAKATGARSIAAAALLTLAACESIGSPRTALQLCDEAAAVARGARAAETLARAHADGIAYSFQVENERPRFIRIERAAEFGRRYGYGASQFAGYRAFQLFASGRWPADGSFGVAGDADADVYVSWVRLLEAVIACARLGPTAERRSALRRLVDRAARQDEPQWAVPWLSYAALVEGWADAQDDVRATADQMTSFASRAASPERSLTLLCRGLPSAAIALFLGSDRERLAAMAAALVDFDGHAGERELLEALGRTIDGTAAEGPFAVAAVHLGERGLALATAFAAEAVAAIRPKADLPDAVRAAAAATLAEAGATWLAGRFSGSGSLAPP